MNTEEAIKHLENMKWLKGYDNTTVNGVPLSDIIDSIIALLKEQDSCENCAIAIEDRQPVVRCKDCKHWEEHHKWARPEGGSYIAPRCNRLMKETCSNWFCADVERKTDNA